ncbi:MAG: transporter substrate-binding domain-containing protein [Lachnospiraceae bacterium]|nr:transporter substrate-binding domain-containing protein [Lachnospiraceae bacterium]
MKKLLSLALVMSMAVLSLAGCGKKEVKEGDLLSKIKEQGYFTVAMEGQWAPWTYHDENDNLTGFEVDVAKAVADKLGVEARFVEGEWDGLLAGVQGGRYDLMANGVAVIESRLESYEFSDPYVFNKTVLIVREDNEDIKSFEDLNGKTTCNSANSNYQLTAESYGATVKDLETLDETLEEVMAGRADATLNAEVSFNDYLKAHPDAPLKVAYVDPDAEKCAMIMPKGENSYALRDAVNEALKELAKEGKLAEISIKYFGLDITKE